MDGDAVQDYELGQVCIRQLTGWPTTAPIDPAFAEHVGHVMRPVLAKAADDVMAAWQAIPEDTRDALTRLSDSQMNAG